MVQLSLARCRGLSDALAGFTRDSRKPAGALPQYCRLAAFYPVSAGACEYGEFVTQVA
ncbi:MAG: hypothetical protein ACF787_12985 [Rhodopirellula sp. JB053]